MMNCLIPFQDTFRRPSRPYTITFKLYCDAANEKSVSNRDAFNIGGIWYDFGFAWQYLQKFLYCFSLMQNSRKNKLHIKTQEPTAQQLGKSLLLSQILNDLSTTNAKKPSWQILGIKTLPKDGFKWNRAKLFFLSISITLTNALAIKCKTTFWHTSCSSIIDHSCRPLILGLVAFTLRKYVCETLCLC